VLMQSMMRARGLDLDQMRHGFATLLRDIERVCTQCKATGRCRRELDAGTADAHCHEYCANAGTFDDLLECTGVPMFPLWPIGDVDAARGRPLPLRAFQNGLQRHRAIQSCRRDVSAIGDPLALCVLPVAAIKEPCRL